MPSILDHHSSATTKLLLVGDSGSGKTGALASLASAGYNVRIADLDNGVDVLRDLLTSGRYAADAAKRVHFVTITDPLKNSGGRLIPSKASVWQRLTSLLGDWKDPAEASANFGPVTTWTPQDVLVIDSLTLASDAALAYILSLNGRLGSQPHQSDWGLAQTLVESLLKMLYDESVKCNVVINCHVKPIGGDNEAQRFYPNTLGQALPPKVGRYFNTILLAQTSGRGTGVSRKIFTQSQGTVELKTTAPTRMPQSFPLETGLADYFALVRGEKK